MSRGAATNGAGLTEAGALAVRLGRGIQRSIAAFLAAFIALPLASVWATYQTRTLSARIVSVEESRLLAQRALRYAVDEESAVRAYLATRRRTFLEPYGRARSGMTHLLDILPKHFAAARFGSAIPYIDDFRRANDEWVRSVGEPQIAGSHGGEALALESRGAELMDRMRSDTLAIQTEGTLAVARTTREMTDVIALTIAGAAAWIIMIALLTVFLQRRAVRHENRLVEAIVREREEVRHLSEWRSRLLAMLAHDFKSQLTVLIGGSHLLEDFPQRRGDAALLASFRSASYSLAEMADNAILLARAQEQKIVLQRTAFDVAEAVRTVVQRYGSEREFNVLPPQCEAMVDADRSYTARVLDNIIGNAVKYSEKPIDVLLDGDDVFVTVSVVDRGIGIVESELPHIFEEFWRSDRTSWKRGGSGVGLFIVKTIMEAHGGSIEVHSRPGQGTTVTLRFPRPLEKERSEFSDALKPDALVELDRIDVEAVNVEA